MLKLLNCWNPLRDYTTTIYVKTVYEGSTTYNIGQSAAKLLSFKAFLKKKFFKIWRKFNDYRKAVLTELSRVGIKWSRSGSTHVRVYDIV